MTISYKEITSSLRRRIQPDDTDYYLSGEYYAKPTSFNSSGVADENPPMYAFRVFNHESFFDGLNSRDFMLPSHYLNEIVMEMAKLIGLRLKDADVVAFSTKEETSE